MLSLFPCIQNHPRRAGSFTQDEFEKVKEYSFELRFRYPTEEERKQLNIINRDMTEDEKQRITKGKTELNALLDDIESGKVFLEDLEENQIKRLRALLGER